MSNFRFLVACLLLFSSFAQAQLVAPFTTRYSTTEKGRIVMIGNTLMQGSAVGANAQVPPGGTAANNGSTMTYVNVDGGTFCSSMDTLKLLPCSDVLFAGLYWGGNASTTAADRNKIKLKGPGDVSFTQFTSSFFANGNFGGGSGYHAFADVTSFVQAKGAGRYTGADVVLASSSTNRCGGWTLVVVFRNQTLSMRNLTVFDGFANITGGFTQL